MKLRNDLVIFVNAIESLSAVGQIKRVRKVEETFGTAEAAVAAVEQGVHKTTLFFAHCPLSWILLKVNIYLGKELGFFAFDCKELKVVLFYVPYTMLQKVFHLVFSKKEIGDFKIARLTYSIT